MARSTTCRCDACQEIGGLDLKFVVHHGTFIVDRDEDDGRVDLAGPDVILAHRLLKNTIVEAGGPEAYAFFSDPCLARSSAEFSLPAHSESYDSFGEVTGVVQDLAAVADRRRESRRLRVTREEADLDVSYSIDAPPSVVWQYWVQPEKRARWSLSANETSVVFSPNDEGRRTTGASSHCAHAVGGDALREYLDWRPYDYFTCRMTPLPHELVILTPWIETFSFTSVGENRTEFRWTVRCTDRSADALSRFEVIAAGIRERATQPEFGEMMRAAIAEDATVFGLDEPTDRAEPEL